MVNKLGNPNFAIRPPEFPPDLVRDISLSVYEDRMGSKDYCALLDKDGDQGQKMAERSKCMDHLTRSYLRVFRQRGINVLAGG